MNHIEDDQRFDDLLRELGPDVPQPLLDEASPFIEASAELCNTPASPSNSMPT